MVLDIAIVGGGISGLATYLQLRKHFSSQPQLVNLTIFEYHDLQKHNYDVNHARGIPTVGGGYGLAANGMASLKRLNPIVHDKILKNSFPTPRFQMKTRQGGTLGAINCVVGEECCCMVTREVVLEALYEQVPEGVVQIRKVAEVVDGAEGVNVQFEGGEVRRFDLVVGADGIWSRCRKAILGEKDGPEYRGLSTFSGFIECKYLQPAPTSGPLPYPQSQAIMTFGPNGFLGYTPCNSSATSITTDQIHGRTAIPRGDMAFWWARSAHEDPEKEPDLEVARKDLAKRMHSWKDPNIRALLEHSVKTAMIPTYALPKQKTWVGKRVVLVGDAAHALPTSSGQGVSQSVEDAEALAMLLAHHLSPGKDGATSPPPETFQKVFEQYMTVRKAHVERILDAGNRGGDTSRDMNIVAEYTMYAFFWIMLKFFSSVFTKELENYHVVKEAEKVVG